MPIDEKALEAARTEVHKWENGVYGRRIFDPLRIAIEAYERALWRDIKYALEYHRIVAYKPPHSIEDRGTVKYGIWSKGELWDDLGNSWNGFIHFRYLPEFTMTTLASDDKKVGGKIL